MYLLNIEAPQPMACANIAQAIYVEIACRLAAEHDALAEALWHVGEGELLLQACRR